MPIMPPIKFLLLAFLFASQISTYVIEPKQAIESAKNEKHVDNSIFQELLAGVDPSALHAALHNLSPAKFKHGAYHEDHTAAEAIHRDDPTLGTSILELARRQNPDSTNSSAVATPTSDSPISSVTPLLTPSSSTQIPPSILSASSSLPPPTVTATAIPTDNSTPSPITSTVVVSPSASPTVIVITTGSTPPPTTVPGSGPTSAPPPTSPGGSPTPSTPTPGEPSTGIVTSVVSSTANAPSTTPGVPPSSEGPGESSSAQAPGTTSKPDSGGAGGSTSLFLQTVTLPNGVQSVISLTSFVSGAEPTGGAAGGSTNPSGTTPGGSLQSQGAAASLDTWRWHTAGVIGGVLGALIAL